jgi:hypothetical protein
MEADAHDTVPQVRYAAGLTVAVMKARVERALVVERRLLLLGWFILVLAVGGLVAVLVLWLLGEINVDQMLAGLFSVVMSSILSGAATYGSGINVGLGAARLAANLPPENEESRAEVQPGSRRSPPERPRL